jgi:hypothetical protein
VNKTSFAGLTELDPGESLFSDGSSFTARNPSITDYYLQLGARLHRHDAAPALADPTAELVVDLVLDGGALSAGLTVLVAYTLLDERGGETLPSPAAMVTTAAAVEAPADEPLTELLYDAGTLTIGSYHYVVTLVDGAGGETPASPMTTVVRDPGSPVARIRVSGLADYITDTPGAERYRLYRAKDTGSLSLLAEGTEANDIVIDDGNSTFDCTAHPPETNTTGQTGQILVTAPSSAELGAAAAWRLYVTADSDFTSPSQYGPIRSLGEAGSLIWIPQLLVDEGAPPDVSTAVAGAAQIDPDTDLLDWHWKRPVATVDELPVGPESAEGDMRLVLDDGSLYSFRAGAWSIFTAPAAHWLPPVADAASLPMAANVDGDVRLTLDTWTLYAWDGAAWQPVTGTGGGGHTIVGGGVDLPARSRLAFEGAGATVTDDAGGDRTLVTVPGQTGGHVIGDGVTELAARRKLTFKGAATVTDDAPGDQTVVVVGGSPRTVVHFGKTMAANEIATPSLALPKGFRLLKLVCSIAARVELYTSAAARTADAARPAGTAPTGAAHGVILDVDLDAGTMTLTPSIDGWNNDSPPVDVCYARVKALAAGDLSLDLTVVRTEA